VNTDLRAHFRDSTVNAKLRASKLHKEDRPAAGPELIRKVG